MLSRILAQPANSNPEGLIKPHARALALIQGVIYVAYSFVVGFFLLCLPWMEIWENNYILYLYPQLQTIVANPFLKGGVLGLGIVNILIGIQEIVKVRNIAKRHLPR
jgi:hypothetical protein